MEPIITSKTKMCRICPNTLNLIDLSLPENDFIIQNLDSFVPVEFELLEQLPKYICSDCNTALNIVFQFKSKILERFQEIKSLIEMSTEPIKIEVCDIDHIEEVILEDFNFEEHVIKDEVVEPTHTPLPEPTKPTKKRFPQFTGKCVFCQKELASHKEMNEHNKTHTECHLCPNKYSKYDYFKYHYQHIHLNIQRKDIDQTYSCQICGKEFKRKKNVAIHIRVFHNKERNFACDLCDKKFFERTQLETHKKTHSDEKPFVCEICSKDFKTKTGLVNHQITHNEGASPKINKYRRLYICTYCGKQFRGQTGFEGHQRIHTKELPYNCKECNKKFRTLNCLSAHKLLHTGEKPYKCNLCPKKFRRSQHLKNHKLSHGGKNVKKLSCNLCGMSTVYKENLETHMKTVHMQIKNFDCKICNENFSMISLLKKHSMESHNLLI